MSTRQNILITGASSGLGEQMAREFAARGRNIVLCARRTERLEKLRRELNRAAPNSAVITSELDVTDHQQVFAVFNTARNELGTLDRVIVNAGINVGHSVGTGHFEANLATANTNFVAALAQCEAAMEIFRSQNGGHLVVISSVSAVRGFPGTMTTYAATKAGLATLAEGIRADIYGTPIAVTTIYPGYIASELNKSGTKPPFSVSTEKGVREMVRAIERERAEAKIPLWPWGPVSGVLPHLPLRIVAKRMG